MSRETAAAQRPDQLEETRPPGARRPGACRLRSLAFQLPRGRRWLDGGGRRLTWSCFSLLISSPWESSAGPGLGGLVGEGRSRIQRTVGAGLEGEELQELTGRERPGQTLCVEGRT